MNSRRPSDDPIDLEIRRILRSLKALMRSKRRTQAQIQNELGWGRSSVSQLFTGQKRLRMDQLLAILRVLDVHPKRFFADLYGLREPGSGAPRLPSHSDQSKGAHHA